MNGFKQFSDFVVCFKKVLITLTVLVKQSKSARLIMVPLLSVTCLVVTAHMLQVLASTLKLTGQASIKRQPWSVQGLLDCLWAWKADKQEVG